MSASGGEHVAGDSVHNTVVTGSGPVAQAGSITGDIHFHGSSTNVATTITPRPIAQWDPFDLDVHRAIAVADPGQSQSLPEMPAYLRREHDDELDTVLTGEPAGNVMLILTGESSTGKTRALYEAVRNHVVLREWPLWYPRTAADLVALLNADVLAPGTVLWLNETQNHLRGPVGEQAAALLRALLERPRLAPVLMLGTLWPPYWTELTTPPDDVQVDGRPQARALLQHRVRRVRIADQFSSTQVATVRADRSVDPRLRLAVATSGDRRRVIQTLAGGPTLVERHDHPDCPADRYAGAIVNVAIDARRLGLEQLVTPDLLADAAPGYLSEADLVDPPDDWFAQGIKRAAYRAEHGITALIPRRRQSGIGAADGYELHDYLEQHGRRTRRAVPVPDALWRALLDHANDPEDLIRLAHSAYCRLLYRYADPLYEKGIADASESAQSRMIATLAEQGRPHLAVKLVTHVPDNGYKASLFWRHHGLRSVVTMLIEQQRLDEVLTVLNGVHLVDGCEEWAVDLLATHLVSAGRVDDAIQMLENALVSEWRGGSWAGRPGPARREQPPQRIRDRLIRLLAEQRRLDDLRRLARTPSSYSDEPLATALADLGCWDEAWELVRRGAAWTPRWIAARLAHAGRADKLRELAKFARADAEVPLAEVLLAQGRDAEALAVLRELLSAHEDIAPTDRVLDLLVKYGHVEFAIDWTRKSPWAMRNVLGSLLASLAEYRRDDLARRVLDDLVNLDERPGYVRNTIDLDATKESLADRLAAIGQWDDLKALLHSGGAWTRVWLPRHLAKVGNVARLRTLAELGNSVASEGFVQLMNSSGKTDEAIEFLRTLNDAGHDFAMEQLATTLARQGLVTELRSRAAAGDASCAQWLISLAVNRKLSDADALVQYGLTTDGTTADRS